MTTTEIIAIIGEAGLSLPDAFRRETPEALARFYNGVGADWFPVWLRRAATGLLERMEPLAFVHDVEFATAVPSYYAFSMAQLRWAYNAARLVLYSSSERYRTHRKRFIMVAWICAACCQLGGWRGFRKGLAK